MKNVTKIERTAVALLRDEGGITIATAAFGHGILGVRGTILELKQRGVQFHEEWVTSKSGARFKCSKPATAEDTDLLKDIIAHLQRKRGAM